MKVKFKILAPQRPDQSSGYDTIINYDPDSPPRDKNARILYEMFGGGYFLPASGSGFDFDKIFQSFGLDVTEFVQVSAYTVSKVSATIIAKEASRWGNVVQCLFPQGNLRDYFKDKPRKHEIPVYEWIRKDRKGKSVILFGPAEEEQDLNLMYTKTTHLETIELPNETALDYFTSNSIFLLKRSEIRETFEALLGDSMSPTFKSVIDNFKDGYNFGMWGIATIEDRFDFDPDLFPWSKKVSDVQKEMREIIDDPKTCMYMKYQKTKNLLKRL